MLITRWTFTREQVGKGDDLRHGRVVVAVGRGGRIFAIEICMGMGVAG